MRKEMYLSKESGVTIIELVVTMVIISIIALTSSSIIISMMQILMYTPREMKAKNVAHEAIEAMIEGETQKRGMRYSNAIVDASEGQFTYIFGYPAQSEQRVMRFIWNSGEKKLYRSYTNKGDINPANLPPQGELIPYYAGQDISIKGRSEPNTIFTYFKAGNSPWSPGVDAPNTIRRVEINIVVQTGSGLFQDWEGSFKTTSGVEIKGYI